MPSGASTKAQVLNDLVHGEDLTQSQAYGLMTRVMAGKVSAAHLAGLLIALRAKGETVAEITGLAQAMRENAIAVAPKRTDLIDTCGTGGDGHGTFNISTATAIVAAAMGCGVAKHGNRAVSSACGSADVLEALDVNISLDSIQAAALVDEIGIGFLFAPEMHPAMKHAMEARRELGVRTVFNILGPLTNPARAQRQLLGVFDPELCPTMAAVLGKLGSEKAYVVHGEGGLDEVSLYGPTHVSVLQNERLSSFIFHPRDVGMNTCQPDDLQGGSALVNAQIIRDILAGNEGPKADIVVLNAAFVAVLADLVPDFSRGVELARQKLADGTAQNVLTRLSDLSTSLAGGRS